MPPLITISVENENGIALKKLLSTNFFSIFYFLFIVSASAFTNSRLERYDQYSRSNASNGTAEMIRIAGIKEETKEFKKVLKTNKVVRIKFNFIYIY